MLSVFPNVGLEGFGPYQASVAFGLGLGLGPVKGNGKMSFYPKESGLMNQVPGYDL